MNAFWTVQPPINASLMTISESRSVFHGEWLFHAQLRALISPSSNRLSQTSPYIALQQGSN